MKDCKVASHKTAERENAAVRHTKMLGDLQNQSGRSTFDLKSVQNRGKSLVKLDIDHSSDNSHHTTFGPWSCCLGSSRCSSWLGLTIGVISLVSCGDEKKDGVMENAEFAAF